MVMTIVWSVTMKEKRNQQNIKRKIKLAAVKVELKWTKR